MTFNRIGIVAKQPSQETSETFEKLVRFLKDKKLEFCISKETPQKGNDESKTMEELSQWSDLIIVIGGDGSMLSTGRIAAFYDTPIVGISRGKLGFLTDICPNDFEKKLTPILNGDYVSEDRFLLEAEVMANGELKRKASALNEIVLAHGETAKMMEFEIYIDQKFMYSLRSDGLIISTPTGSTAYALSAGGPIVHPKIQAVVMIPMFPHSLTYRPIVIDSKSQIDIKLAETNKHASSIVFDGQDRIDIIMEDTIHIHPLRQSLKLIHPKDYCYFKNLRSKLHWGQKLTGEKSEESVCFN